MWGHYEGTVHSFIGDAQAKAAGPFLQLMTKVLVLNGPVLGAHGAAVVVPSYVAVWDPVKGRLKQALVTHTSFDTIKEG